MIDYNKELVKALSKVLPTHYELALTSKTNTPCISYQERNNASNKIGDTLGYGDLMYTIKVWANQVSDIQKYSLEVDNVLRGLGFKRVSTGELSDNVLIQKIMTYKATYLENY